MSDSSREPGWERATLEKLAFAALNEQRSARRWKIFFRLAWLALLAAIAFAALRQASPSTSTSTPHTAVVDIKGEIASGAEASAEFVVAAMRSALEDEGSQALVLLINSPGGSPVQAGIINDEIVRLKAKHKKPIYAVVEETCASAAYYIAAAADDIYVDKASIVGSIGVLMDGFGFTGTMEKLGVELDEQLGLARAQRQALQLLDALCALLPVLRQVADKGEVLPVEATSRQRQQQRHRPDQWHHAQAQVVRSPHHR